jgi:hypothetical protein
MVKDLQQQQQQHRNITLVVAAVDMQCAMCATHLLPPWQARTQPWHDYTVAQQLLHLVLPGVMEASRPHSSNQAM